MKGSFVRDILAFFITIVCQAKVNQTSESATAEPGIQFTYQDITGMGSLHPTCKKYNY